PRAPSRFARAFRPANIPVAAPRFTARSFRAPRQRLGQHFLIPWPVLEGLAAAVCPAPVYLVVEIGPGRGALTEKLLKRAARVVAVEVDPFLVEHLRRKFAGEPRLEVVHADVLHTDLAQRVRAPVAGN